MSETITLDGRTYDTRFFPREKTLYTPIEFSEQDFRDNVLDTFCGLGRGDRYDKYLVDKEAEESGTAGTFASLAEMFSKRICSPHVKSVIFLVFGETGSGKSLACLQLALHCAIWIAHLKGGKATDYFTMKNVAVISDEVMENMVTSMKYRNIYIYDDSGALGFSARSSQTTGNKAISACLQVVRPLSNILIFSCPHSALLDCNAKRLSSYYAEVSEQRHDEGYSFLRVFRLSQSMRDNTVFHSYLTHRNQTAIRHYVELPPEELVTVYNKVRNEQMASLIEKSQKKIENKREGKEPREPKTGKPPNRMGNEEFVIGIEKYLGEPTTLQQVADGMQMHDSTLRKYLKKNGFTWKRLPNSKKSQILKE